MLCERKVSPLDSIDLCQSTQVDLARNIKPWRKKPFENIVGKEENAGNQHFLLFPQCFLSYETQL